MHRSLQLLKSTGSGRTSMSDISEQQETSLDTMQSILDAQKRAYLAEGEVSFATRSDRLERAINVVRKNEKRFVEAMSADFGTSQ
jgi:coniferyl-aldehyde dehydrogenase